MFDLEAFELANLQNLMLMAEFFDYDIFKDYAEIWRRSNNQKESIHQCLDALVNLRKDYDILEQKYWDDQRLIDLYDRDNKELEKSLKFWRNRCYKLNDENYIPLKNKYDELVRENIKLKNRLAIERIQAKEDKRYLEAYQKLYVDECIKNRRGNKETLVDSFLAEIKKNVFKVDPKEE